MKRMKFKVEQYPYDERYKIFSKDEIELEPNKITCLVGCNGSGKTALINNLMNELKLNKAKEITTDFYYNTLSEILSGNDPNAYDTYFINFDKVKQVTQSETDYYMNSFKVGFSSTGEGIIVRYGQILKAISMIINNTQTLDLSNKTLFMFFDDCDAGTSIDMILDIKKSFEWIIKDCIRHNITFYLVLTANAYEMCKDYNCISVQDFENKTFEDYESFKSYVIKSRELKSNLYNNQED